MGRHWSFLSLRLVFLLIAVSYRVKESSRTAPDLLMSPMQHASWDFLYLGRWFPFWNRLYRVLSVLGLAYRPPSIDPHFGRLYNHHN